MSAMCRLRRPLAASNLRLEFRFIRTLQAPDHIVLDKASGRYRISSKAFGPSSSDGTLSGDLEQLLVEDGLDPLALYPSVDRAVGAASLTIGNIQALGLSVEHQPVNRNWYHGGVRGIKTKHKKQLMNAATEIVPIDQAEAKSREAAHSAEAHGLPGSAPVR